MSEQIIIRIPMDSCYKVKIDGMQCSNIVYKRKLLQSILEFIQMNENAAKVKSITEKLDKLLKNPDWGGI